MGQAQINVRTWACSGTFIARTKQVALTHNVRGKELNSLLFRIPIKAVDTDLSAPTQREVGISF